MIQDKGGWISTGGNWDQLANLGFDSNWNIQMYVGSWSGTDPVVVTPGKLYTKLGNNYPNPFNPETEIKFSMADPGVVSLNIYNLKGQLVKTLVRGELDKGVHSVKWDGTDNFGKKTTSGIYFYKMTNGRYTSTKKMIMLK